MKHRTFGVALTLVVHALYSAMALAASSPADVPCGEGPCADWVVTAADRISLGDAARCIAAHEAFSDHPTAGGVQREEAKELLPHLTDAQRRAEELFVAAGWDASQIAMFWRDHGAVVENLAFCIEAQKSDFEARSGDGFWSEISAAETLEAACSTQVLAPTFERSLNLAWLAQKSL